jgi:hypothetical protein
MGKKNLSKRLDQLNPLARFVASVLAIITANWPVAISVATAVVAASWTSAVEFIHSPVVLVAVGVFLALLWTIIGITILIDRRKPRSVKSTPDYRYGLTFEGLTPNFDVLHEDGWLSFGVQIRNFSQAPIRYEIKQFDLRLETRTLPKLKMPPPAYVARGAGRTATAGAFKKTDIQEFFGKRVKGTAEFDIVYGHPEDDPLRRLQVTMEIILHIPEDVQPPFAFGANIVSEVDEPY